MGPRLQQFEDWKAKAHACDILQEAVARGAQLKRRGKEHVGPCPACGGTDRFSIHVGKGIFNCRGSIGGDVITLVCHLDGLSFLQACEVLTGEPPPHGDAKPISDAEQAARAKQRAENEARQRARQAQQMQYEENTKEAALAIWNASVPLPGSTAEAYLRSRGIDLEIWPDVLRSHPSLLHQNGKRYPALVCRVDDLAGHLTAVWRIFLRSDGRKADTDMVKMGLGPAAGGAVRIGGLHHKIAVAEGVESALGYWLLTGCRYPAWAALSTSGMIGLEVPLGVEIVEIAPDGDRPMKRQGEEYVPAVPAGRKAAESLRSRLLQEGVGCVIAAEPSAGKDYNDLWLEHSREVA